MRKLVTLTIALMMLLSMTACAKSEMIEIKLGTSDFSIILPEGYENTEEDYDENQIAYYYKDDESIDFDVYQWDKEDQNTLESEKEYFANEYGSEPELVLINGINCVKYISSEEYDGYVYTVLSYMFEEEDSFLGLCFWATDTDEDYAAVDAILNTLKKN